MLVSDAPPPPQRTAGAKRSALAPAARDRRDQNPTVHPKREPRGSKAVRQEPKKLTARNLKTDAKSGISKPPTKSRTVRKNERAVQLTQATAGAPKAPKAKKGVPAARKAPSDRQGSRSALQRQKQQAKEEKEDRNLPVRLHKKEGVPPLGIPSSAKPNSQLHARKRTSAAAS